MHKYIILARALYRYMFGDFEEYPECPEELAVINALYVIKCGTRRHRAK